ncbi:hypothetical protein PMI06_001664 [Burkholderia sp. BT03]|nr:hypothetical protein PMI06_001664 [Burkholderia sp. BT03]
MNVHNRTSCTRIEAVLWLRRSQGHPIQKREVDTHFILRRECSAEDCAFNLKRPENDLVFERNVYHFHHRNP